MHDYEIIFNSLVNEALKLEWPYNIAFKISRDIKYNTLEIISKIFANFRFNKYKPVNRTCLISAYLSTETLIKENICHTVTVGDFSCGGELHYDICLSDLINCLHENNYNSIVQGHLWITLNDGTILDFTCIDSLDESDNYCFVRKGKYCHVVSEKEGKFKSENSSMIIHHPLLVGPGYLLHTGFDLDDKEHSMVVARYLRSLENFKGSIFLLK